ncbi:putative RNA-binding protein [Yarrowia sp. B02]|nr:putative RNA-binding protein [Yarrowia sp. B02]
MSDSDRANSEIDVPQNTVAHSGAGSGSGSNSNSGVDSASSSGTSTSTESIMSADQSDQTRAASSSSSLDEDDDHYSPKYEPTDTNTETNDSNTNGSNDSNDDNLDDLLRACSGQQSHDSTQTAATDSLQRILHGVNGVHGMNGNGYGSPPTEPVSETEIKSPLTPEEASQFSEYRRVESEYINSGNWDKFPVGSRMFIGNLPGDRIDTMELFKLFNQYGRLAQISIKRAYGFVQYFCPEDCERAMKVENGRYLRGFYLKLEVAQPQSKNRERRRSVSPNGYKNGDRYRSRSPGGSESDRNGDRGRSRRRDLLSRKKPHIVPEVQIVMESRVDRDFVHQIERPIKQNGMSVNYQWLQPRTSLKEALPDIVHQLIRERVFGLIQVERLNQQANKVNLQVFHPTPDGGVRFDEYQMVDIPVAVELLGRVKRDKMANFHSHSAVPQPHMGSPPAIPTNGYYGMPAIPGVLPNPAAGMGLPGVGPMGIPMGIPTLSNDQVATLMALQTRLDTMSLQKVALALQQQAAMQQQHQPQHQQGAYMPQFMSSTIPNVFPSPSPPPTKSRHHNGNGKNGFSKRSRADRNGDRNNSADRGRSGPLPYGPVSNRPQPSAYVAQHTNRKAVSESGREEPAAPAPTSGDPGQNVKSILDQLANLKG